MAFSVGAPAGAANAAAYTAPQGNTAAATSLAPDPYGQDSYTPSATAMPPAPVQPSAMPHVGMGSLLGGLGGGFLGWKFLLPKIASAAPSMLMKVGVIGGAGLLGAWLVGKFFGQKQV